VIRPESGDGIVRLQKNLNTSRSVPCGTLTAERIVPHTVQGVGPITALTWALEMDDVSRFRSIDKAITYCGLCSDDGDAVPRRSGPRSGSKVWEAPNREIGKPGENRGKVIAHRDLQPAAAFHD